MKVVALYISMKWLFIRSWRSLKLVFSGIIEIVLNGCSVRSWSAAVLLIHEIEILWSQRSELGLWHWDTEIAEFEILQIRGLCRF